MVVIVVVQAVIEAPLAGNVDDPEGSLDALMQVIRHQEGFHILRFKETDWLNV